MHGHASDKHSEEYKALYHYYESQYIDPILKDHSDRMINAPEEKTAEAEKVEKTEKTAKTEKIAKPTKEEKAEKAQKEKKVRKAKEKIKKKKDNK